MMFGPDTIVVASPTGAPPTLFSRTYTRANFDRRIYGLRVKIDTFIYYIFSAFFLKENKKLLD